MKVRVQLPADREALQNRPIAWPTIGQYNDPFDLSTIERRRFHSSNVSESATTPFGGVLIRGSALRVRIK
jgi:hypothetical protein